MSITMVVSPYDGGSSHFDTSPPVCVHAVPAFGLMDEAADLQDASMVEYQIAKRWVHSFLCIVVCSLTQAGAERRKLWMKGAGICFC